MLQRVVFAEDLAVESVSSRMQMKTDPALFVLTLVILSAEYLWPPHPEPAEKHGANRDDEVPDVHAETRCFDPYSGMVEVVSEERKDHFIVYLLDCPTCHTER